MSGNIKKAVSGKTVKVPVILQLEVTECGAACLAMVLAYYGKWVPLEQVRLDCGVSRDGSNAKNILLAARRYGMNADGYRHTADSLKEKGKFPCIIHWEFNHFVVLEGFKKNEAVLMDPARGRVRIPMEAFEKSFTGVCIMLEPSEEFVADGTPKDIKVFIRKRLLGAKKAFIFTAVMAFFFMLFDIINPLLASSFLDKILPGDKALVCKSFFILVIMAGIVQIIVQAVQVTGKLREESRLAVSANSEYMWHILRLPIEFFNQRTAGDIAARKGTNEKIAQTLIQTLSPLIFQFVMMAIYLVLMFSYNIKLSMIGLAGTALNIIVSRYISVKRADISRVMMRDEAKLMATAASGIDMIETVKANGAENGFFEKWSGYQASVNTERIRILRMDRYYGMIPRLVNTIVNMIILAVGIYYITCGQFTVGVLFAFQSILMSFMEPAMKLAEAGESMRQMRVNMERVEDVLAYPTDVEYGEAGHNDAKQNISYDKLQGKIELKNVTFGYSRLAPPLIENFNMTVERGQRVAFVGNSGCGKSTLSKLISGLYKPWSGEILFDGKPVSEIDRNIFTGSLAVVDQEITLFEDTISDNIKMWDESIEDYEMIIAAKESRIHEDIVMRDGGYHHRMLEGGKDFSGGQRQRMEIARVLAQDPTVIIMDEATSALDAKTEYEVVEAIRKRGMTCIVIAHRLSTIRDCDEIIVMDNGKIAECGKHEELMELHGIYEKLIMSE